MTSHAGPVRATLLRRVRAALVLAIAAAALVVSAFPGSAAPPLAAADGAEEADDAGDAVATVDILPVSGLLDPPVAGTIIDLLEGASAGTSELVIIQVDGPGGVSVDMAGLVAAIEEATVPVAVLVAPDSMPTATAAGAWGVLWAAADIRIVSQLGAVGPLLPVDLTDRDDDGVAEDVLAAMDPGSDDGATVQRLRDETVPGLELEQAGLVDVLADNYLEVMDELDGREVETAAGPVVLDLGADRTSRLYSMSLLARMLHAAATPTFIYLLLVLGLGMLAFELFQPGFGVAGFAGLLMLPFAVFGLTVLPVTWWALALLLVGLVLFVVDTAIAGFGGVTAAATAAFGVGSWFVFGTGSLRNPTWVAAATTLVAVGFWVIVMTTILRAQAGPEGVELDDLVGKLGIVRSLLNPEGHVYIDDALWRARLEEEGRLRVSAPIRVVGVDGAVLVVRPYVAGSPDADADPGGAGTADAVTGAGT
jgi:membrane-bound serine protease (ClpP class)